jgi:ATP-dependent protease HslVU (ClpYQ) peptidase subunit
MSVWIIKRVIPLVIKTLEDNKAIDFDKGTALANDAEFLIATHGKVFLIDEGFGVTPIEDYFVSGSGGKIALGALHAQKSAMPDAWESGHVLISIEAIKAAIEFDLYSSGKIQGYKSLPNGRVIPVHGS